MKNYYWIAGNHSGLIKAKNMKEAFKKTIIALMPEVLDEHDKNSLFFGSFKVIKGKRPKYWG